jgi:hypothetical protein
VLRYDPRLKPWPTDPPGQDKKFPVGPASAKKLGYDPQEMDALPPSVTESFCGIGNPLGLGELLAGQTVLDLGSGAGMDSLLAARRTANIKTEGIVADECRKILGSTFIVGKTHNGCSGNPHTARILVGAHYDSMPGTPGTDDNASVVAVMLAVARSIGPCAKVLWASVVRQS